MESPRLTFSIWSMILSLAATRSTSAVYLLARSRRDAVSRSKSSADDEAGKA